MPDEGACYDTGFTSQRIRGGHKWRLSPGLLCVSPRMRGPHKPGRAGGGETGHAGGPSIIRFAPPCDHGAALKAIHAGGVVHTRRRRDRALSALGFPDRQHAQLVRDLPFEGPFLFSGFLPLGWRSSWRSASRQGILRASCASHAAPPQAPPICINLSTRESRELLSLLVIYIYEFYV